MAKGNRDKIKLVSSAGTGHYYTATKNKKLHPEKLETKKYDPTIRKHVVYKEATVIGSTGRLMFQTWERMAKLVKEKRVDLSSLVTHRLPLDKADKGFQAMLRGKAVKVLLTP